MFLPSTSLPRLPLRRTLSLLPRPTSLPLNHPPPRLLRTFASASPASTAELQHTRNIGIIAHIDAVSFPPCLLSSILSNISQGKTTTTERMLYYSGFTRRIGDVDDGSTVMDYLPAERARGITITSAAITFSWMPSSSPTPKPIPHTINLIDTPGHADFTFEVERSIRVLDGAVTILDGVAGVEAQTEKVWRQSAKHGIPRIIFVNKLDRVGARFGATVREVAKKLNGWPAVVQLPVYENNGKGGEDVLRGVVDVVEQRVFLYEPGSDGTSIDLKDYGWLESTHPTLHAEALAARISLVELLSNHDDALVEEFLELEDHAAIPASSLKRALRNVTLSGSAHIIPILCGASFRNIGVQPLLDAVIDYLPSPLDRPSTAVTHGINGQHRALITQAEANRVCALAFKVVNDPKRGAMVFIRVYSGVLNRAHNLWNSTLQTKERAHRLLQMYADEAVDITSIPAGHIGVVIGLKSTRTGDTLVDEAAAVKSPKTKPPKPVKGKKSKSSNTEPVDVPLDFKTLQLKPIDVPPPVFFAALEPHSLSAQKQMEESLAMLLREDPSLNVTTDPDSGQTLISGMGELHLEIARDRLVGELKAKADMGRILIAFRESITTASMEYTHIATLPDGTSATVTASVMPIDQASEPKDADVPYKQLDSCTVDLHLPASFSSPNPTAQPTEDDSATGVTDPTPALLSGATAALSRGPHHHLPLHGLHIELKLDQLPNLTSPAAIASAARQAIGAAVKSVQWVLIEPVMRVIVTCDEAHLGKVVNDISGPRGGVVLSLGSEAPAAKEGEEETERINAEEIYVPKVGDISAGAISSRDGEGDGSGELGKREVVAIVPLERCVGYLKHLRSLTKGRGSFVMELEGWERVGGQRVEGVLRDM